MKFWHLISFSQKKQYANFEEYATHGSRQLAWMHMRPIISPHIYTREGFSARSKSENPRNIITCARWQREGPPSPWLHLCQKKTHTCTWRWDVFVCVCVCWLCEESEQLPVHGRPNNNRRYPLIESMRGRAALCSHSAFCRRKTHMLWTLSIYERRSAAHKPAPAAARPPLDAGCREASAISPCYSFKTAIYIFFFSNVYRIVCIFLMIIFIL